MNQNYKNTFQTQYLGLIEKVKKRYEGDYDKFQSDIKESYPKIEVFIKLLEEMLTLSIEYDVPDNLALMVTESYGLFSPILSSIANFDFEQNAKNNLQNGVQVKSQIDELVQKLSNLYRPRSNTESNILHIFFSLVSLIKGYKLNNLNDIELLKKETQAKIEEVKSLDVQVRTTAQQVITQQYAKIFEEQANKHSYFKFSLKDFKIGAANLWLGFGLLIVISGLFYVSSVHTYDYLLSPFWGFEWENIDYPLIANRIIFLVLWLGIVKFSFKQYSIHSHLYVVNKHRQNVMNSFKLLHDSLIDSNKESDRELQKILALEVARVIFESGQTGFVQTPDLDVQSPDILEIIKALKSKTLD